MRQGQFSFILYSFILQILVQCYLIYPQTVSITLEGWCAKGSLVFTTGNPLYIHVTFSRSFSVGRVVNFPKFQFILSPGPLGHPPITPLCSSNWAPSQDAPPTLWTPLASTSPLIGRPCCLFFWGGWEIYVLADIRYGDITWNTTAWISSC